MVSRKFADPREVATRDGTGRAMFHAFRLASGLHKERRSRDAAMLRIQRSVDDAVVRFTLSGRVQAEHLPELQRMIDAEAPQQRLTIDLAQVDLVDRDAVGFLASCETRGIMLENGSAYIRESIARERTGGSPGQKPRGNGGPRGRRR